MDVVDLSGDVPLDSVKHELVLPNGKASGWKIDIAGPGHPNAVAWVNAQAKRSLERRALLEAQQMNGRKIKPEFKDVDAERRENLGWFVSRILGWNPVKLTFIEPEPIAFSEENAYKVFLHPRMGWAVNQIVELLENEKVFTPSSEKA